MHYKKSKMPKKKKERFEYVQQRSEELELEILRLEEQVDAERKRVKIEVLNKAQKDIAFEAQDLAEKMNLDQIGDPYIVCLMCRGAEQQLQTTTVFAAKALERMGPNLYVRRPGEDNGYTAEDMSNPEIGRDLVDQFEKTQQYLRALMIARAALQRIHAVAYEDIQESEKARFDPLFQTRTDEQAAAYWDGRARQRQMKQIMDQENAGVQAAQWAKADAGVSI